MSAPLKDDSHRLPHYGRDGVPPNWLKGWKPPEFPNIAPIPVIPGMPNVPGLPWWVDPWIPPMPQPLEPEQLQPQTQSRQPAPNTSTGRTPIGAAGGLVALLQELMLRNEKAQGAGRRKPNAEINNHRLDSSAVSQCNCGPCRHQPHFPY